MNSEMQSHGIEEDRKLVDNILRGSTEAWHEFLRRYSGLIFGVVKRHLFSTDEDEKRSLYVDVLEALYNKDLSSYKSKASLSTWLIVYTRARVFDHARKKHGRYRTPREVKHLNKLGRRILQLHIIEKLSLSITVHVLRLEGFNVTADDIVASIQAIEGKLDRRYLKRLDDEFKAQTSGAGSVRVMRYLINLRAEYESDTQSNNPDVILMRREAAEMEQRVRELVARLPKQEQRIIRLRFGEQLSARKISEKTPGKGPRQIYTIVNRIVNKIRVALMSETAE